MGQTLGQLMVNDLLPAEHRGTEQWTKSSINKKLTVLARQDPKAFVGIVSKLKKLGDEVSTWEGVSVGLDDIVPEYESRDKILGPAVYAVKNAKTDKEREKIILDIQEKMLAHTKTHPGSMTVQALSGSRGNVPQLMKIIASPVAAVDAKGQITPWLISKSYGQGLSSADYWVTGNEARINTIKSATSVAEPGDVAKMLVNTMYPLVITKIDCGTHNGIAVSSSDPHARDRYLARDQGSHKYNDLVTPAVLADLRRTLPTIYVRSPMTCAAREGVCQKCQGLDEKGHPHQVGVNVGVRASGSISEPLTQFALNAKHGVRLLKSSEPKLEGMSGLRQLLEVPESFLNKAILAEQAGKVTSIKPAAHGGHYVHVNDVEHYVGPNLSVLVREGQVVEAGDRLSAGIPKPDEIVRHKGLGAGREYLVKALHDLYKDSGAGDVDKRHFELLVRADLTHGKILEHSEQHPHLLKGDLIHYNDFKELAEQGVKEVPLEKCLDSVLGHEVLHFTVGTHLTASILETLKQHGYKTLPVSTTAPKVVWDMAPLTRSPLRHPDFLARLAHRYLSDSLVRGAHRGDVSDLHGTHPIAAYMAGSEFGEGRNGAY